MNRQIILSLPPEEFAALQRDAAVALRPVKDQARYIIRCALLGGGATPISELPANQPVAGRPEPVYSP